LKRRLMATAVAMSTAAVLLGTGGAWAQDAPAPETTTAGALAPAAVPTTTTLPLFGAPLTVDITTGPGGVLASVSVNPAEEMTATTVRPNKVAFVNEDGTARVVVKARDGAVKVEARAGSLADVSGPGRWSGDVFGTGVATVDFVIGALGDGTPDISGIVVSGLPAEIGAVRRGSDDDDDGEQEAKVKITFTDGIQSRTLSIKVEVESDDGDTRAKLQISLSKLRGVSLPASEVAGAQAWTGVLCNGSAARIDYTVAEDGAVSGVSATPPPTDLQTEGSRIDVRFSQNERVKIRVKRDDGELRISVDEKIRCDAPPPSVNTDVSSTTRDDDDDDDSGDNEGRNRDNGGNDNDNDESTSTTVDDNNESTSTTVDDNNDDDDDDNSGGGDGNRGNG
jgi:hypothetical protein